MNAIVKTLPQRREGAEKGDAEEIVAIDLLCVSSASLR